MSHFQSLYKYYIINSMTVMMAERVLPLPSHQQVLSALWLLLPTLFLYLSNFSFPPILLSPEPRACNREDIGRNNWNRNQNQMEGVIRNPSQSLLGSPLLQAEPNYHGIGDCKSSSEGCWEKTTREFQREAKKQMWLAGPLISVGLLTFSLHTISLMFVGHLGELPLSGASMGTSFAYVTGFSFLLGMASALETTCGQSYGGQQYHMLGIHMQRAVFVLLLLCVPLGLIWANSGPILIFLGQNHEIANQAGDYTMCLIPGLFAYSLLQCLIRFLQTQNIVFPMMLSSGVATLGHLLGCWLLVFKLRFGIRGAALSTSMSYWINTLVLMVYVKCSSSCSKTWTGLSKAAFQGIPGFLRLAVPSALMVCLEMWSFEMVVLLAGLLPNPALETSVLSISTRVSNELGAGNPRVSRLAVIVVLLMTIGEGIVVGLVMILIRNVWGYAYSSETEVISYLGAMMPVLAITNVMNGLPCVLSGVARGCGWQKIGAYINLGSFYLVGIPCALLLAFTLDMGGRGLWLGLLIALFIQVVALLGITATTNWEEEAEKAEERIGKSKTIPEVIL